MVKKFSPNRVAILGTRGIPAQYGGFETFAEELSFRLVSKKIEVTVYCVKVDNGKISNYKGVQLHYIRALPCGPFTTILFDLLCLFHARKKYDVVYMLGYGTSIFCFLPRLWGTKVLINMDGIEWMRSKWNFWAKLWLKFSEIIATKTATMLIADAQGIYDFLKKRHRTLPPVSVLSYGASCIKDPPDNSYWPAWGLVPQRYYLVVCRLVPENHVEEIMKGFFMSPCTKRLIIVGDLTVKSPYIRRLLQIKSERITFTGTIYEKETLRYMRYHAFAYFHGHSVGGTNPSLLEALGCGNAVIAHDNTFNREVAGDAALYFKTDADIPAIVNELEQNIITYNALKNEAYSRIETLYNWEHITNQYCDLLNNL
jgi:glycosyltransferase involved in cell wall biosynthesis